MTINKPTVFNYRDSKELRDANAQLLEHNNKLIADNKRLRNKLANLEIKLRIKEADNG